MHRMSVIRIFLTLSGTFFVLVLYSNRFIREINDSQFTILPEEMQYQKQAFTGAAYELHPNKQLSRLIFYWKGKRVGSERQWYPTGDLWVEKQYRNGLLQGESRQWYDSGRVKSLGHYDQGQPHGEFWGWHPNGNVSDYNLYDHGREITHKSWISDGKPFYNYVYQDGKKVGVKGGQFCKLRSKRLRSS